jgi:hypothetical protein
MSASGSEELPLEPASTGVRTSQHTSEDSDSEEESSGLAESDSLLESSEEEEEPGDNIGVEGAHSLCCPPLQEVLPEHVRYAPCSVVQSGSMHAAEA